MVMQRRVLIDQFGPPLRLQVIEGQEGGALIVEGKIGHVDKPTANNRVYPRKIMEREIKRLQHRIEQGSVLGAVDHPGDGKSRVREAGCIMRGLKIERNGEIHGRFEVVEEADAGRNLAAFLRRGAAIGMSSRGLGSTTLGPDGHDYVGEDFRLSTWDFVADPACHDAYPQVFTEDTDEAGNAILTVKKDEVTDLELRKHFPKLVRAIEEHAYGIATSTIEEDVEERIRKDVEGATEEALVESKTKIVESVKVEIYREEINRLREDFATKLVRALGEMRSVVEEEVRSDFNSDPEVAGAKITLAKIAEWVTPFKPAPDVKRVLDEKDMEIEELRKAVSENETGDSSKDERIAQLETKGKALAYQVYVERNVANHPNADALREMIGNVGEMSSTDELKAKVAAALEAVDDLRSKQEAESEAEMSEARAEWEVRLQRAESAAERAQEREHNIREAVESKMSGLEDRMHKVLSEQRGEIEKRDRQLIDQSVRLTEAVEAADRSGLVAYASERAMGHPKRRQIMEAVVAGKIISEEQVDHVATRLEEQAQGPGGPMERVRRAMSQGREHITEDERRHQERVAQPQSPGSQHLQDEAERDLAELGTSLQEQTHLAGIPRPQ